MGFSLKKLAEEVIAQVNPFDSGKTAQTVRQARQAPPAVTQRAPQQQPSYGGGITGVVNRARDVVDANTTQDRYKRQLQNRPEVVKTYQDDIRNNLNQVKNAAINAPLSPNKLLNNENGIVDQFRQNNKILGDTAIGKKITSGTLGFRDNFDANTVYDRQRRLAEGKGEWQKPIQASIASATKPMVEPFVKSTQKLGNMIVEGNRIAYNDLPRAIAAQATGNKQAMNNVVNGIDKRLGGQGMFGGGMPSGFNSLDQGSKGFIEDPNKAKDMLATGTEIGTTIAPVGPAATLGVNAFKQPIKQTVKTGTKALLANGVLSGGESAARQYMQNGKIDAKQVATDAGLGATISTALPFAGGVIAKGAPKLTRGIANQTPKIVNKAGQSIDDVFNGVRQAYDGVNKQGGFVANPFNKGDDIPPKTEGVVPTFETLPADIHPSLEAKAVGVKRIAPDRVGHQQLTPEVGIQKLVEQTKEMYDKRSAGWTKIASDADALIKKYGDKMPLRRKVDLNKYPDFEKDMATYNYLKKNTYGTTGGSISKMRDQFMSNAERTGWNETRKKLAIESAPKAYIEAVKKDISKGYRYPEEVLNYDKSFRTAVDSRARYEKGLYTSFSSDDHRIVFDDNNRISGGMKRQDGKELSPTQKDEIVNGVLQTQNILGINLDQLAKDNRWVYAHLNGKNPFLTKNAAGLYRGGKDHASISVGGTETFNTVVDGKRTTKRVNTTMAHELGHALDLSGDKRLFDREAIWKLKNSYNSVEGGFRGRSYWGNDREVTARAIAQYVQVAEGSPSAYTKPGNWDKATFDSVIKPEVERAIGAKYPQYKITPQTSVPTPPKPLAPKTPPIEKTPNPTVTAIEEAGAKIRPVKQVPEKPPITPPEKPVKTPIDNPPEQFDELPVSHTKKVGLLDKAFRSTRSIIERQGKTGKELSGMLQKQRDVKELYVRDLEKRIPTVQKLKDKEYPNFVDATQGLAKPASAKIEKAVAEWKAIHPEIRDRAVKAGLDVGDLGETYYPHFIDYDKVFKDNNTYNQAINHIVKTGQAESREEAIKLLGYARDISRNRQFGNLEASRIVDIPFYDKSKQSLGVYLQGSADRITKTEIFGKNDEIALKKIANIGVEGGDTEAAKNAFDIAVGAKQYNPTSSKISGAVRKYTTVTRLGLGALTNVSQNVNTGVVTGHMRTLGAVMKQLSPKTRQWAADTGVISDAVLNDLKHGTGYETFGSTKAGKAVNLITAPGFKQVESLNRKIAATAGRDYGLRLAQKGDEKTLRKLGVTGEIKNNTLTDEQQIQVARKVVEKTQFKVDPQDLPGWADTPGGKLVAQFRTFSYNQGKFFSNEVLKPLAKGNVMPLARVLAALPVGYALYETRRVIDGRPEEENNVKKGLASFQKIGGAGLALDIYQQLNPVGSKYLPSDRRVSMATGALGGPTVGTLSNMVGSLSEAIQRKRTPDDESRLDGKIAVGNTGESYTDLTALSRFGLQQIPIVGTPMANRLIPYKKQSDADTGKTSNTATKNPGDGVAKASSSNQLTYDQAINIQKKEYGGKYADYTESEIKELAKTDGEAKQYLSSLEATKKAFGSPKELPEGLHPSAAKVYQTEHRLTDEGKTKWNAKESNDQYIKDTLKNWNNGEEVPVTNEIAKAWAEYEKNRLEGKISNLEMNNEKKKVLRKAYSSVLNQDERGYFGVPDGDIISGLEQGLVTPESLQKALDVDALLVSKGLLSKSGFGKTVWNALGLNAPKSPTAKTTSSRTSRVKSTKVKTSRAKTGGKTAKGGKYNYNLFMFGDAPTKSKSLRDLVNKASAKA